MEDNGKIMPTYGGCLQCFAKLEFEFQRVTKIGLGLLMLTGETRSVIEYRTMWTCCN